MHHFCLSLTVSRCLLLNKYIEFTEIDEARRPDYKEEFCHAQSCSEDIASDVWLATNNSMVQLYNLIFSFSFLLYSCADGEMYSLTMPVSVILPGLLIMAFFFVYTRLLNTWNLVKNEETAKAPPRPTL